MVWREVEGAAELFNHWKQQEEAAVGYKPQGGPVVWGTTANGKS